jgi:hypothetical protein
MLLDDTDQFWNLGLHKSQRRDNVWVAETGKNPVFNSKGPRDPDREMCWQGRWQGKGCVELNHANEQSALCQRVRGDC